MSDAGSRLPPALPPLDDSASSSVAPDEEDEDVTPELDDGEPELDVDPAIPEEDEAPASGAGAVPPVTVIVRVVFATASPAVPAPFADIAATQSVIVPFVCGAVNENL